jgi:hypothetical protein
MRKTTEIVWEIRQVHFGVNDFIKMHECKKNETQTIERFCQTNKKKNGDGSDDEKEIWETCETPKGSFASFV